jgi:hypothetical protein
MYIYGWRIVRIQMALHQVIFNGHGFYMNIFLHVIIHTSIHRLYIHTYVFLYMYKYIHVKIL